MFYTRKRKYTFGIAVLLCTALVFLGCEEASSSSGPAAPAAAPEVTAEPADGQVNTQLAGSIWCHQLQGISGQQRQRSAEHRGRNCYRSNYRAHQRHRVQLLGCCGKQRGGSKLSAEVTATPRAAIPPAPTGLTAVIGNTEVVLTWTASTHAGVTGYKIRTMSGIADMDISGRETATGTVMGLTNGTVIQLYHSSSGRRHGKPAKHCSNGNTA